MRPRISIRGCVCPTVGPSVGRSIRPSVLNAFMKIVENGVMQDKGASRAVYPALFAFCPITRQIQKPVMWGKPLLNQLLVIQVGKDHSTHQHSPSDLQLLLFFYNLTITNLNKSQKLRNSSLSDISLVMIQQRFSPHSTHQHSPSDLQL